MAHPILYAISCNLVRWFLTPFIRVHVVNQEVTARPETMILAANHISHFDPLVIGSNFHRTINWMAMRELFENPILGAWCRSVDAFPVDRSKADRTAVKTALARLAGGTTVGMFPEGGIRDGAKSVLGGADLRAGIGALAQLSGCPVLPIAILGTDRLYNKRAWLPVRGTPVWLAFGEPIRCGSGGKHEREAFEHEISEAIRGLAKMLRERFQLTEDDLPQPPARRMGRV